MIFRGWCRRVQCALDLMRDELGAAHPAVPVTMKEMAFAALIDMTPQKGMVRKEEGARCALACRGVMARCSDVHV